MTVKQMRELFDKHSDEEYLEFSRIEKKRSGRPDLHAFLLLDELCPDTDDMVVGVGDNTIYLSVNEKKVADKITEEQVIELLRCGCSYEGTGFCMFT